MTDDKQPTDQELAEARFHDRLMESRRARLNNIKKGEFQWTLTRWLGLLLSVLLIVAALVVNWGLGKAVDEIKAMPPMTITKVETVVEEKMIKAPCPLTCPANPMCPTAVTDGLVRLRGKADSVGPCELNTNGGGWVEVPVETCPDLIRGMVGRSGVKDEE